MKHVLRTTTFVVALASLAMMAAADQTHKHKSKSAKPTPLALSRPSESLGPMVGTWMMKDGEKPNRSIRMVFRPNGTFAFVGPNWQSTGKYKVQEHKLSLEWSSVDGEKVKPGVMHKDFAMGENDSSFTIDKYTYFKLGD
jgi:hypothetical protein